MAIDADTAHGLPFFFEHDVSGTGSVSVIKSSDKLSVSGGQIEDKPLYLMTETYPIAETVSKETIQRTVQKIQNMLTYRQMNPINKFT